MDLIIMNAFIQWTNAAHFKMPFFFFPVTSFNEIYHIVLILKEGQEIKSHDIFRRRINSRKYSEKLVINFHLGDDGWYPK